MEWSDEARKEMEGLLERRSIIDEGKRMGFSLSSFFKDLQEILAKDKKADKKIRELSHFIEREKKYAELCGQLRK